MSVEQLRTLIAHLARALVDAPDAVEVTTVEDDHVLVVELSVAQDDLGKVIGKDGRTARAMRTLLAATAAKMQRRAILEILE